MCFGMIDDAVRDHLEAGVAIIVGTASPNGRPHASRGYGAVAIDDRHLRVFLDASDAAAIENARTTRRVAVTTGDNHTFQSLQCKGTVESVAEATPDDHAAALAHMERFWDRVTFEDNVSRDVLARFTPVAYVTCTMHVEAMFDQTPGPRAGGVLEAPSR